MGRCQLICQFANQWPPLISPAFSFPIGRSTRMMSSPRMSRFTCWLVLERSVRGTFVPSSARLRVSALKYAYLNTYLQSSPLGLRGPWGPRGLPYTVSVCLTMHRLILTAHTLRNWRIGTAVFSVYWIIHAEICTLSMGFLFLKDAENVSGFSALSHAYLSILFGLQKCKELKFLECLLLNYMLNVPKFTNSRPMF